MEISYASIPKDWNLFRTYGYKAKTLKISKGDLIGELSQTFLTLNQCTLLLNNPGALGLLVNMPEGLRGDLYH